MRVQKGTILWQMMERLDRDHDVTYRQKDNHVQVIFRKTYQDVVLQKLKIKDIQVDESDKHPSITVAMSLEEVAECFGDCDYLYENITGH